MCERAAGNVAEYTGLELYGAKAKSMVTGRWISIFRPRCSKIQIQILAGHRLQGNIHGTEKNDNAGDSRAVYWAREG